LIRVPAVDERVASLLEARLVALDVAVLDLGDLLEVEHNRAGSSRRTLGSTRP
jgi:hypothetical protein